MRNADLLIYIYFLFLNYAVFHEAAVLKTSAISAHPAQFSNTFHRLSQIKQISHQDECNFSSEYFYFRKFQMLFWAVSDSKINTKNKQKNLKNKKYVKKIAISSATVKLNKTWKSL